MNQDKKVNHERELCKGTATYTGEFLRIHQIVMRNWYSFSESESLAFMSEAKQKKNSPQIKAATVMYAFPHWVLAQQTRKSKAPCHTRRHTQSQTLLHCNDAQQISSLSLEIQSFLTSIIRQNVRAFLCGCASEGWRKNCSM